MLIQGLTGVQRTSDGQFPQLRTGKDADLIVSQYHGRYYETTYRGTSYTIATQAVATTTVGLATTYTGLCVANPTKSPVNLVLNVVSFMQSVIQATQPEAYAIAVGFNATTEVTLTAAVTPISNKVGSGTVPQAKAATSATLPTAPTYQFFAGATSTATADPTANAFDLAGSIILIPGAYACWVTPAQASVAGLWFSFSWEEVPI